MGPRPGSRCHCGSERDVNRVVISHSKTSLGRTSSGHGPVAASWEWRQLVYEGHLGHPQHAEGTAQVPPRQPDLVSLSFPVSPADAIVRQGQQQGGGNCGCGVKVVLWGWRCCSELSSRPWGTQRGGGA